MTRCFFHREGDELVATELTRGPWDNRFQHGGPPSALLCGALEGWGEDRSAWFLAGLDISLLRPVPIGRLRIEVAPQRAGRTVQRLVARLFAGEKVVVEAHGLRIRRHATSSTEGVSSPLPWAAPEACPPLVFDFFRHEVGYHRAVELRTAHGAWGATPIGLWTRPTVQLIAGEAWTPRQRLVAIADAQSGMGVPLDPQRWAFVNPDLHVRFERDPVGAWMGFDIRAVANDQGSGLVQSEIRDELGIVARSAQAVLVSERG